MLIGRALAVLSLSAVLISGLPSSADDSELSRATLEGLTGVYVLVEGFEEVAKRAGFDKRTFQTDVELELRTAGIKVLSREESFETPGHPLLYVQLNPLHKRPNEIAAYSVIIIFKQRALLERDPSLRVPGAATWSQGTAGEGDISDIREEVKDLTDIFINAWFSVNPKE